MSAFGFTALAARVFSRKVARARQPVAKVWSRVWFCSGRALRNAKFSALNRQCRLHPQKRTWAERVGMCALCQKRTHALQQFTLARERWLAEITVSFDYFVGGDKQ